jgi:dTMP kinase
MFVTIEGGEGAGKSTLIEGLAASFDAVVTREPGGSRLSEGIRALLLDKEMAGEISHRAETLLFLAARAQHLHDIIEPALDAGKLVLCDRFNDSTVAYQGYGRELGPTWVASLCEQVCGATLPSLTLLLDIDPEEGLRRAAGEKDRLELESLAFHQRVRTGFLELAHQHDRIQLLDATLPADQILSQAQELIHARTP